MWHLTLRGVRQHREIKLSFPENGIVMLQGKSGVGKTTIMDAIEEGFFGTASDLAPWGSSKYLIEIIKDHGDYLRIVRTGGPKSLTVTDKDGIIHKDDAAQKIINDAIGMNQEEFPACSYIKQGAENSLLNLGPTKQLYFIESLSNGSVDTEAYKKAVLKRISNLTTEIKELEIHLSHSKSDVENLDLKIKKMTEENPDPKVDRSRLGDIPALEEEYILLEKVVGARRAELSGLQKKLQSTDLAELEANQEKLKTLKEKRAFLGDEESSISEKLKDFASVDPKNKQALEIELKALSAKIEYLANMSAIKDLAANVRKEHPESAGKNLTDFLNELRSTLSKNAVELARQNLTYEQRIKEIEGYGHPQSCPDCSTPLIVDKGRIAKPDYTKESLEREIQVLKDSIADNLVIIETANKQSEAAGKVLTQSSELKSRLTADPVPEIKDVTACHDRIAKIQEKLDSLTSALAEKSSLESSLNSTKDKIAVLESEIAIVAAEVERIQQSANTESKDAIQKQISAVNEELNAASTAKDEKNQILNSLRSDRNKAEMFDRTQAIINSLQNERAEAKAKLDDLTSKLDDKKSDLAAETRFKELSDFAAVKAIERTIAAINASAEPYMDKMFPEDGTVIQLKNTSTTSKGEERAKISIDIFHKGRQAKKLANFSGGEKSRSSLAFQLGLSDMYKSPLLLVDEGFAGLGEEDKKACLEVLKDVSGDRLILVIEHGAPESFFDEVVRIG